MGLKGNTRRDRSRDGVFKGGKYKFWKLSQTTICDTNYWENKAIARNAWTWSVRL